MDGGLPWASVISLGVALVGLGAFGAKVASLSEKVKGLERSRDRNGERLAALEKRLAIAEERRRLTEPGGYPRAGGGRVDKEVTDESSTNGGDEDG